MKVTNFLVFTGKFVAVIRIFHLLINVGYFSNQNTNSNCFLTTGVVQKLIFMVDHKKAELDSPTPALLPRTSV